MRVLKQLFDNNRAWAESISRSDPDFFKRLARQQSPNYLWIGCSDSRVPANQIVGLLPGDMFVHRNIANVVEHTDLNCLSVLQFAIDVLKIEHVIVCGHYGCAGIRAAMRNEKVGLADRWLDYLHNVGQKHASKLSSVPDGPARADRFCELNVIEQVMNVCQTDTCRAAWDRGQPLTVHGWIYGIQDGLLRDLHVTVVNPNEMLQVYNKALSDLS